MIMSSVSKCKLSTFTRWSCRASKAELCTKEVPKSGLALTLKRCYQEFQLWQKWLLVICLYKLYWQHEYKFDLSARINHVELNSSAEPGSIRTRSISEDLGWFLCLCCCRCWFFVRRWSVSDSRTLIYEVTPVMWLKSSEEVLLKGFKKREISAFVPFSRALQHQG